MRYVAGCDEAGRGSLAGPLVAAAVLLDYGSLSMTDRRALSELDDSKKRSPEEREALYPAVVRAAARVSVTVRCVAGIDQRGLHVTNCEALARSLERVAHPDGVCLVDGFRLPRCRVEHRQVIDGDARSAAIAAASVVAKVTRDRFMERCDERYPGFG
ncbi:MAG: ribonuclease HII, partial [Actinomycetota bacterium]|nr:ribonuclease HII [Actinomycetota bacterium]